MRLVKTKGYKLIKKLDMLILNNLKNKTKFFVQKCLFVVFCLDRISIFLKKLSCERQMIAPCSASY